MPMLRGRRSQLLAAALCLLAAACGASRAYHQGLKYAKKGDWDLAVARLTKANQEDPENIGYKISLENVRLRAGRFHYDEARKRFGDEAAQRAMEAARKQAVAGLGDLETPQEKAMDKMKEAWGFFREGMIDAREFARAVVGAPAEEEKRDWQASFVGLTEEWKRMQTAASGDDPAKRTAKATEKLTEQQEKALAEAANFVKGLDAMTTVLMDVAKALPGLGTLT